LTEGKKIKILGPELKRPRRRGRRLKARSGRGGSRSRPGRLTAPAPTASRPTFREFL
jgi:hypothetical protein